MRTSLPTRSTASSSGRRGRILRRTCAVVAALSVVAPQASTAVAAPSAPRTSAVETADLAEGSIGPRVKRVQEALIRNGAFLPGGADGVYGPATTTAIVHFQTWNDLERTGTLDATTVSRLGLTSDPGDSESSSRSTASTYSDLSPGSRGPLVSDVQRALLATGLVIRGGADGAFGDATAAALRAFQRVNGLDETGAMSPRTERLLDPADAPAASSSSSSRSSSSNSGSWTQLRRFPVQGHCAYGDTWHAARGSGRVHEGVDIIASSGKLLYAVADGEITTQWWDLPGRRAGNGLKLTAADGTYFVYLHLSAFAPGIQQGTRVEAGDVIGFVGSTGSSATPHLHFEIHPHGGAAINPYPYVKAIDDCSDTRAHYQSSFG